MKIKINDEDIYELFEILCDIPFRKPNSYDFEPPTERPAGIDNIIKQLLYKIEPAERLIE